MADCSHVHRVLLNAASALLLAGAFASPSGAQSAASAPAAQAGPTSAEKYQNIQALKELPAAQLHDAMVFIAAALGTTCEGCHVRSADGSMAFDKDDKRGKQTARKMIQMVDAINARDFNGQPQVNCMTCHQGHLSPMSVPPLASAVAPAQPATPPAAPGARPKPPAETVDQVVAKFVDALGGHDALAAITSRTRKGSVTVQAEPAAPLTIDEKGGTLYRATIGGTPGLVRGVNATGTWAQAGDRVRDLTGVEAAAVAVNVDLTLPLEITQRYTTLAVRAYDTLDGRDVIVMNGRRSPDVTETLYFDRQSGLLLRRVARARTAMGRLPLQVDYADYRTVGKVKMPFEVRVADWSAVWVMKFTDITLNPALDEARFAKPAAKNR